MINKQQEGDAADAVQQVVEGVAEMLREQRPSAHRFSVVGENGVTYHLVLDFEYELAYYQARDAEAQLIAAEQRNMALQARVCELEASLDDAQLLADERGREIDALKAELAQYDLGEWEDDRLKEWLPGAAEVELIARLEARAENYADDVRTARIEAALLRQQLEMANKANQWRPVSEEPTREEQSGLFWTIDMTQEYYPGSGQHPQMLLKYDPEGVQVNHAIHGKVRLNFYRPEGHIYWFATHYFALPNSTPQE